MANCICCGKKLGVFSGAHLDNSVCDSCYFRFAGYVEELKIQNEEETIENAYVNAVRVVSELDFQKVGKVKIIDYIKEIKENKLSDVEQEKKLLQRSIEEQKIYEEAKKRYIDLKINILLTTSSNFEGYKIKKYCGVKSGSVVLGTGFLSELSASISDIGGWENDRMVNKIEEAKSKATEKLINACIGVGGNAIIGIEYDIMTIGVNMIVVSANGTSVLIEKMEE